MFSAYTYPTCAKGNADMTKENQKKNQKKPAFQLKGESHRHVRNFSQLSEMLRRNICLEEITRHLCHLNPVTKHLDHLGCILPVRYSLDFKGKAKRKFDHLGLSGITDLFLTIDFWTFPVGEKSLLCKMTMKFWISHMSHHSQ